MYSIYTLRDKVKWILLNDFNISEITITCIIDHYILEGGDWEIKCSVYNQKIFFLIYKILTLKQLKIISIKKNYYLK